MVYVLYHIFVRFVDDDHAKIQYVIYLADHTYDESILLQLGIPFNKSVKSKALRL